MTDVLYQFSTGSSREKKSSFGPLKRFFSGPFSFLIFWGYNLVFSLFVTLFFLNIFLTPSFAPNRPSLWEILTFGGMFPVNVVVMLYLFFATPPASIFLGLTRRIRHDPKKIIRLFFGFEIPVMGLVLLRVIFFRQVTLVVWVIFAGIAASVTGLLFQLLDNRPDTKRKLTLLLGSQQIALVIAGYAFAIIFFFLPIIAAFFIKNFPNPLEIIRGILSELGRAGPLLASFEIFFILTVSSSALFFTLAPVGASLMFLNSCRQLYRKTSEQYGKQFANITRYGTTFVFIILLIALSVQVRKDTYASLIKQFQTVTRFEEKQKIAGELLKHESEIKSDLRSRYLAQYRYLSDTSMNMLAQGYKNELGTETHLATSIQNMFNFLAAPFIYKGVFEDDIKKSAEDYMSLFDNSIQKGEKEEIIKSLAKANTQDSFKAGLLDENKKTIHLVSRTVIATGQLDGQLTKVTIEEEYENTDKRSPQEVYYEFSLPDDAVITELKLGPDLEIGSMAIEKPIPPAQTSNQSATSRENQPKQKIDTAQVAPKGAANTVYERSLRRSIDPAFLAQVGPRQYKLRIFPIPVKGTTLEGQRTEKPQKNQKMRFSYITMNNAGAIPMPDINEQRNIYLDSRTKFSFITDGKEQKVTVNSYSNALGYPAALNVSGSAACPVNAFETQIPEGMILYLPHAANPILSGAYSCKSGLSDNVRLGNKKIAILLDVSYSNNQKDIKEYLNKVFENLAFLGEDSVDLYFFNDSLSEPHVFTPVTINNEIQVIGFGKTDRLSAIKTLPPKYDLVLLVSDSSVFDAGHTEYVSYPAPLYMVHWPRLPVYDDALTNVVIQSNGGVESNGTLALKKYFTRERLKSLGIPGTIVDVSEHGTWILLPKNGSVPAEANIHPQVMDITSPFGLLAARKGIVAAMRTSGAAVQSNEFLDKMQQVSQTTNIVSPYSSMIVLVTQWQKDQLKKAMNQNNRYELALDIGEEDLGNPSGRGLLEVGAVPEPHEWVLLISGSVLFIYLNRGFLSEYVRQKMYVPFRKKHPKRRMA